MHNVRQPLRLCDYVALEVPCGTTGYTLIQVPGSRRLNLGVGSHDSSSAGRRTDCTEDLLHRSLEVVRTRLADVEDRPSIEQVLLDEGS